MTSSKRLLPIGNQLNMVSLRSEVERRFLENFICGLGNILATFSYANRNPKISSNVRFEKSRAKEASSTSRSLFRVVSCSPCCHPPTKLRQTLGLNVEGQQSGRLPITSNSKIYSLFDGFISSHADRARNNHFYQITRRHNKSGWKN